MNFFDKNCNFLKKLYGNIWLFVNLFRMQLVDFELIGI